MTAARTAAKALLAAALLLAASGCSLHPKRGGYYQDDGSADTPANLADIPDAVPRAEPLSRSGNRPYTVNGRTYYPLVTADGYRERGIASWYGKKFHGRLTSSGEPYDMYTMTAAHRTLPLPSYARVTNLENGRSVVVRVNDRGPFLHNRLIDLSYAAAAKLGILGAGTGLVEVEAITPGAAPPPSTATTTTARSRSLEVIPTAHAAAVEPPRLYVQAGAFVQHENAARLRARLEQAAFHPVLIESAQEADGRRWWRVRIGPAASVEEADRLTERLAAHGVPDALIVVE